MKLFRIRMTDELHEALRQIAFRKRVSMNALAVAALGENEEVRQELASVSK